MSSPNIVHLKNEGPVSSDDLRSRIRIAEQLRRIPPEAFAHMQHLQAQTGCRFHCAACSQYAANTVTGFTERGLENFLSALRAEAIQRRMQMGGYRKDSSLLGYGRDKYGYKGSVIQTYFDDDCCSFPFLDTFLRILTNDFHVRPRLSTVGYSRNCSELQEMHERIASGPRRTVDTLRLSFSKYPRWSDESERDLDITNMLRTYRPLLDEIGVGRNGMQVEIRFPPSIETFSEQLDTSEIHGHHVLHLGPYFLISKDRSPEIKTSEVIGVDGRRALLSEKPLQFYVFISDSFRTDWKTFVQDLTRNYSQLHFEKARIPHYIGDFYALQNSDGPFFSVDPTFLEDGRYRALNIYPRTGTRRVSGYLDESRYFMNAVLALKVKKGIVRRGQFPNATWEDIAAVLENIQTVANGLDGYHHVAANYIRSEVYTLIERYAKILNEAGYPSALFFNKGFTADTGQIYNMGRAMCLFGGLVTKPDEPLTVGEMREPFLTFIYPNPWRLCPVPLGQPMEPSVAITQLNRREAYKPIQKYLIRGVELREYP